MYRVGVTLFIALIIPLTASAATIQELQAQIALLMTQLSALQQGSPPVVTSSISATQCPNLSRNLSRGMKGSDVTQLQQFLISQNLLTADSSTGFYGALTEAAVKKFQCANMSICSGSADSNGYGAVGPRTRAKIGEVCGLGTASSDSSLGAGSADGNKGGLYSQASYYAQASYVVTTYSWHMGEWGPCTNSQQTRTVQCKSNTGAAVADSFCSGTKPVMVQSCTGAPLSCTTPWGATIPHGSSTTAFQAQTATQCVNQTRTCTNGVLSGTYQYASCSVSSSLLPNPTVKNMEGIRGGFRNVYAPSVATVQTSATTTAKRMWLCGWKTDADPNDYNAAIASGQPLTTIIGPDKIWMSEFNGTTWSDPTLSFQKVGFHVCDPSIVRPPSTDGVDRSQWTYMYYTALDNRHAASPIDQVQNNITGLASSVDGGRTWQDIGIVIDKAGGGDGMGAWAPAAVVAGDEIWLYYATGNQNFSINATYRQRMNANGWQKIGAPEPLTYAAGLQFNEGTQATLLSNLHVHKEGSKYVMLANTYDLKRVVRLVSDNGLAWRSETTDPVIMNSGANFVITPFGEPIDSQNFSLYFGYGDTPPALDSHGVHRWTFGW